MSYLPLPDKTDLEGKSFKLLEDAEKRWGYTPNICKAYALAPAIMEAEDAWSRGVMHQGQLSRKLKEAIATTVSAVNNCHYCANSHAHAYTLAGGSYENAIKLRSLETDGFSERVNNVLSFVKKATKDPKSIIREDIYSLRNDFTDSEIIEIVTVIQQFMGYNWFVTILGLNLEDSNPINKNTH